MRQSQTPGWKGKHYAFFQNLDCEYFPCHRTKQPKQFNCLFCYCPLYFLDGECGGNFVILDNGIKDCSACMLPHQKNSYGYIIEKISETMDRRSRHISDTD